MIHERVYSSNHLQSNPRSVSTVVPAPTHPRLAPPSPCVPVPAANHRHFLRVSTWRSIATLLCSGSTRRSLRLSDWPGADTFKVTRVALLQNNPVGRQCWFYEYDGSSRSAKAVVPRLRQRFPRGALRRLRLRLWLYSRAV